MSFSTMGISELSGDQDFQGRVREERGIGQRTFDRTSLTTKLSSQASPHAKSRLEYPQAVYPRLPKSKIQNLPILLGKCG